MSGPEPASEHGLARGFHLERAVEPIVDVDAVIAPRLLRVGSPLEAIVLKALEVFGEADPASVVVQQAGAVKPLVGPPKLSRVEASIRNGARRQ